MMDKVGVELVSSLMTLCVSLVSDEATLSAGDGETADTRCMCVCVQSGMPDKTAAEIACMSCMCNRDYRCQVLHQHILIYYSN